jgi:hypothetical protein
MRNTRGLERHNAARRFHSHAAQFFSEEFNFRISLPAA